MSLDRRKVVMLDTEGHADGQGILITGGKFVIGSLPTLTAEDVRDTIGTALQQGAGITITVNDPGDTITIAATGARTVNAQTGTSYTLALTDAGNGKFLTLNNAGAITLTVPTNASVAFPVGTVIALAQLGAGQVTIAPASGVTVNAVPGLKVAARYGVAELLKTGTDTWLAYGRLSA